jgi:hypothetical protein
LQLRSLNHSLMFFVKFISFNLTLQKHDFPNGNWIHSAHWPCCPSVQALHPGHTHGEKKHTHTDSKTNLNVTSGLDPVVRNAAQHGHKEHSASNSNSNPQIHTIPVRQAKNNYEKTRPFSNFRFLTAKEQTRLGRQTD